MLPIVSVLVCTYNRCESLRDTLQAIAGQIVPHSLSLEVLIVDNHSTDETRAVIEETAGKCRWPVRYLFESVQGKAHALNLGIRQARGELIVMTDDDVVPEATWVQALYNGFQTFRADCIGGKVLPLWLAEPPRWLVNQRDLLGSLALLDRGPEPIIAQLRDAYFIYGANMAIRRSIVDEVGVFRTDLGPVGGKATRSEDTEFAVRVFRAGKRVVYTPTAVVRHKVPPARMRLGYFRRWKFHQGRSEALTAAQEMRGVPRWLIRQCVEHGAQTLWAYGRGRRDQAIEREMQFWFELGKMTEYMRNGRHGAPALDGAGAVPSR